MTPGELTEAYQDVEAHIEAYRQLKSSMMSTSMEMLKKQEKTDANTKER